MKLLSNLQNKLVVKATLLFSAAILLVACLVVVVASREEQAAIQELAFYQAEAYSLSAALGISEPLQMQNNPSIEKHLQQISQHTGLVDVFALGQTGTLFSTGQTQASAIAKSQAQRALTTGARQVHRTKARTLLSIPVLTDNQPIGVLSLAFSPSAMVPSFSAILASNLWKGFVLLGLGLPLSLLVFNYLFSPIKEMIRTTNNAASGDLSVRANILRRDEFGTLASAINLMLERMKANLDRTRWLAYGDEITRLANKTAFSERLRLLVDEGKVPGTLFLIDLDGFKRLNDAYGQEEGDKILRTAGDRLRKVISRYVGKLKQDENTPGPMLARFSGDEFALLAPGCVSAPLAQEMAQSILAAIGEPMEAAGQPITLSARLGIAMFPHDASDSKTLLNSVNFAIDVAKESGGNTWQFFEPSMTQAAIRRITLQNEMRHALINREFIVYYQPKINVRDGSISGCEALVRWQKSPGKILSPGAFIDVAEETGLINEIGDYVLAEACAAAARWAEEGSPCPVAVNVSAHQFSRDNFSELVSQILEETGLPYELLELELTESVAMTNPERLMEQVAPLRERGVRFAIDDFGTGHSSLSYLTRLPFDVFKIDQSFVREMTEDKNARVIVQTILAMAESLGYRTVAEGVETREHFAFLQLHCCDYVQGYYFSRPVPETDFTTLLIQDRQGQQRKLQVQQPAPLAQIA